MSLPGIQLYIDSFISLSLIYGFSFVDILIQNLKEEGSYLAFEKKNSGEKHC